VWAGVAGAVACLFALRLRALHAGLLYPDGYQYLLMARGIDEHLRPVPTLGPGGDTLAPSADAAAKPLFPALVALGAQAGLSPLEAARLLTAAAGAAVAPLAGLVALRLGASRTAAVFAAALCLASPTLGFWLGFPGPDALALALALGASLALVSGRPIVGGALAGLAVSSRPELIAVALGAGLAATTSPRLRRDAALASTAALTIVAVVLGVVRPPLAGSTLTLLAGAAGLGLVTAALVVFAGRAGRGVALTAASALAVLLALAIAHGLAWRSLAGRDWALLVLAGLGLLTIADSSRRRATGLRIFSFALVLALVYWWKNPGSERYLALLLPALAVVAALGLYRRPVALATGVVLAVVALAVSAEPSAGPDSFSTIAAQLSRAPAGSVITAAPDAYGTLVPGRGIRVMRPGATGLVLIDGAARAYEPQLRVAGRLIARYSSGPGFVRPDGRLDRAAAFLYLGTVVRR
jgi:hypothetical protein